MSKIDTGLCHRRGAEVRSMYRTITLEDTPPDAIGQVPVHVWCATGGPVEVLTVDAFNAAYIVDYRFDLRLPPVGPGDPDWTPEQTPRTPEQWAAWGAVEDEEA
jgi:hypothetical protein